MHDRLEYGMQHLDWFYNGTLATHVFGECAVCGGTVCRVCDDWQVQLPLQLFYVASRSVGCVMILQMQLSLQVSYLASRSVEQAAYVLAG